MDREQQQQWKDSSWFFLQCASELWLAPSAYSSETMLAAAPGYALVRKGERARALGLSITRCARADSSGCRGNPWTSTVVPLRARAQSPIKPAGDRSPELIRCVAALLKRLPVPAGQPNATDAGAVLIRSIHEYVGVVRPAEPCARLRLTSAPPPPEVYATTNAGNGERHQLWIPHRLPVRFWVHHDGAFGPHQRRRARAGMRQRRARRGVRVSVMKLTRSAQGPCMAASM